MIIRVPILYYNEESLFIIFFTLFIKKYNFK